MRKVPYVDAYAEPRMHDILRLGKVMSHSPVSSFNISSTVDFIFNDLRTLSIILVGRHQAPKSMKNPIIKMTKK